jgi:hypothetical protein
VSDAAGPFRIEDRPFGPHVLADDNDLRPGPYGLWKDAEKACADANHAWSAAGGPALQAECVRLRVALEWYASDEPYSITCASEGGVPTEIPHFVFEEDRGARARAALSPAKETPSPPPL